MEQEPIFYKFYMHRNHLNENHIKRNHCISALQRDRAFYILIFFLKQAVYFTIQIWHISLAPSPLQIPNSACPGAPNLEPNSTIHKTKIKMNKIRAVLNIAAYVAWRGPCPIISSLRSFLVILQMYKLRVDRQWFSNWTYLLTKFVGYANRRMP